MAYNLAGLDPKDPRFQQLMAQALRNGSINPVTMESQVEETISGGMGRPSITMESQVEDITSTPLSSGMASAYVDQAEAAVAQRDAQARARSLEGRERKIDSQRSYADSLRGRGAPQGMTAGPLDVYYGPNIGQSLEYAGNQLMGGYMAGKANEADVELDLDRGLEKTRLADIEQGRYDAERAMELADFNQGVTEFGVTSGMDQENIDIQRGIAQVNKADKLATQTREDANQEFSRSEGKLIGWQNIKNPEDIVYKFEDKMGTAWNKDGETLTSPWDHTGYQKFDPGTKGSTDSSLTLADRVLLNDIDQGDAIELKEISAEDSQELAELNAVLRDKGALTGDQRARRYKLEDAAIEYSISTLSTAQKQEYNATRWSDVLRDPVMQEGMGFQWSALAPAYSGFAIGSENAPQIREFQRKLSGINFEGMAKDFGILKLGQITKPEFQAVEKANISWKDTPYGAVSAALEALPIYQRGFNEAIKDGTHSNGMRDNYVKNMKDSILYAAVQPDSSGKSNFPISLLEAKGIDVRGRVAKLLALVESDQATAEELNLLENIARARKREKESK